LGNTTTARVGRHSDVQELRIASRAEISRCSNEEDLVPKLPRHIAPANAITTTERSQGPEYNSPAEDGASFELAHGTREQRVANESRIYARGQEGFGLSLA